MFIFCSFLTFCQSLDHESIHDKATNKISKQHLRENNISDVWSSLHRCHCSLFQSLPLGFHLVALLFSTICAGNRLLSVCTRLLIQELVCTDDGTPFTMLIKVAAARSEREMAGEDEGGGGGKQGE